MEILNDMALFVEVVKAMSFRRAAEAMGMPNSTLSRHISELEKAIGLRLLHRTTRKIELTEAGQIYFTRCKRIVDEARLAHEELTEMVARPSGVLRASLPVDFAAIYLAPLIVEFAQQYPEITFELDLTPRRADLVTEPFDVAIRMGALPDSNLIARQIATLPRFLYASPRYLEKAGMPIQPSDLANHQCIRMGSTAAASVWPLQRELEKLEVTVGGRFSLNSIGMIRRLATLGMGIAVMVEDIVSDDVANGRLVRILPDWSAPTLPVFAITETRLLPAKTQRLIEFLRDRLRQA